jgi:myo-inositol catabolism protein IolH
MPKFGGKIAIESGIFKGYSLEAALGKVKSVGYDAVELSSGVGRPHIGFPAASHFDPVGATEKDTAAVKKLLAKHEVDVVAIFVGGRHLLAAPDERTRKTAVADMRKTIRSSRGIGCDIIASEMTPSRMHLALMEQSEVDSCRKAWLKSIRELLPELEKTDTYLALEPHPGDFTEDNDKAVDLIRDVGSDRLGNLYCFPHTFNFTGRVQDMIKYAGKTLMHTHFADTIRADRIVAPAVVRASPELTLRFRREVHAHLIPGRGEVDFKAAISALKQVGYKGYLSVQCFAHSDDPVGASEESLRYVRSLIS